MPIYEFHCDKCDNDSEILVRSRDWKGTKCPHCGSVRLTKRLSVFASTAASTGGNEACCAGDGSACGVESSAGGCCCGGGKHHH
jgi:putative FmdB family regulatory protein